MKSTPPSQVTSPPLFNLNTISRGFSTTDFYLAVPAAVVHFLEGDTQTKLIAKPQLRGAEGTKITLNLGDQVPIVTTSYTPIATGGAGVNPLNSFQFKDVGINVDILPSASRSKATSSWISRSRAARSAATSSSPELTTRPSDRGRSRDACGCGRRIEPARRPVARRRTESAPGFSRRDPHADPETAVLEQRPEITQTDIVMLLTPHIVRAPEITQQDLQPVFLGAQNNLSIGGPPPLIATNNELEAPTRCRPVRGTVAPPAALRPVPDESAARLDAGSGRVPARRPRPPRRHNQRRPRRTARGPPTAQAQPPTPAAPPRPQRRRRRRASGPRW